MILIVPRLIRPWGARLAFQFRPDEPSFADVGPLVASYLEDGVVPRGRDMQMVTLVVQVILCGYTEAVELVKAVSAGVNVVVRRSLYSQMSGV